MSGFSGPRRPRGVPPGETQYFFARDAIEIARQRMFEAGGGDGNSSTIARVRSVEQRGQQSSGERVAGANPIDHLNRIAPAEMKAGVVQQAGRPMIDGGTFRLA